MKIRPATKDDVPNVLPMVERICALHESWDAARYGFLPGIVEKYRGWLTKRATDERSVFLVAANDAGELAGFLVGTVDQNIPIYRVAEIGFVHDVWVEPAYRNEGVGRQLTMLAIERFRAIGVTQIRLETASANDAARGLFARCGFRESVVEMLLELEPPMNADERR